MFPGYWSAPFTPHCSASRLGRVGPILRDITSCGNKEARSDPPHQATPHVSSFMDGELLPSQNTHERQAHMMGAGLILRLPYFFGMAELRLYIHSSARLVLADLQVRCAHCSVPRPTCTLHAVVHSLHLSWALLRWPFLRWWWLIWHPGGQSCYWSVISETSLKESSNPSISGLASVLPHHHLLSSFT